MRKHTLLTAVIFLTGILCTYGYDEALWEAIKDGNVEVVRERIKVGANLEAVDKDGWTALMRAVSPGYYNYSGRTMSWSPAERSRHAEIVRELINARAKIDAKIDAKIKNNGGSTVFMLAGCWGHAEIVRELINAKVNIEAKANYGRTALIGAASIGNAEVVRELIKARANVNASDDFGMTALMYAVIDAGRARAYIKEYAQDKDYAGGVERMVEKETKYIETVKALIEARAGVNAKDNFGTTVLIHAAANGHAEIVGMLIKARADIEAKSSSSNVGTALTWAAMNGQVDAVRVLIEERANINATDLNGRTALMNTASLGNIEMARMLIKAGARIDMKDKQGKSAERIASDKGHSEFVKTLRNAKDIIAEGPDEERDANGKTALMLAVERGSIKEVRELIKAGANINAKDNNERTAMMIATGKGHAGIIRILNNAQVIVTGGRTESLDVNGRTPMMNAAISGKLEEVQRLIEAGDDMEARDSQRGGTALMFAVEGGHVDVVKALIEAGADIEAKAKGGWTALMIARKVECDDIVTMLEEASRKR